MGLMRQGFDGTYETGRVSQCKYNIYIYILFIIDGNCCYFDLLSVVVACRSIEFAVMRSIRL